MAVLRWIDESSHNLPSRDYEQTYGIWTGSDYIPVLERQLGITAATLHMYQVTIHVPY